MEPLWTIEEVSAYLRVPVKTLYQWRHRDQGPKSRRIGKHLRYKRSDVITWFDSLSTHA